MHRIFDRLLIALFSAGLAVPAAVSLARPADADSLAHENRRPTPPPEWNLRLHALKKLPANLEAFFNDRLAFRERLLNWHAAVKVERLGVSSSEKVVLGRDGWLFLDEQKSVSSGPTRAPAEQCTAWRQALGLRSQWCAARGIQYVVVLTPEKEAIYPEFLPVALRHPRHASAAERLVETSRDGSLHVLDLRPPLRRAKTERQVYYRTDTHWNDAGGFCAYQALVRELGVEPLERSDFDVVAGGHLGDLNRMLHRATATAEQADCLRLRRPQARRLPDEVPLDPQLHSPPYLAPQAWGCDVCGGRRAILLHDSFAERVLLPVLAEHFECLVYVPTASFDPRLIDRFRPDLVIQQIVERKINRDTPLHPAGFGK